MQVGSVSFLVLALSSVSVSAALAAPERTITEPKSIISTPAPRTPPPPVAALFDAKAARGAAWTPDGQGIVVSANLSGRFNLWLYPAKGGAPTQISKSDDRQSGQSVSPDGKSVIFESDRGGGEYYDLFLAPLTGGAAQNLTQTPDVSETGAIFSPDGRLVAFDHKLKAEPMSNIAVMSLGDRKVRILTHETEKTFSWRVVAFTPDGKALIANRSNTIRTEGGVFRIDLDTGAATPLIASQPNVYLFASSLSPDGRKLALSSNAGGEQVQAAVYDLASERLTWLAHSPWEEETDSFSPDSRKLLFGENADGRTRLSVFDIATGANTTLNLPPGVNEGAGAGRTSFSPDSRQVLVNHTAGNMPADYWVYDLATGQGRRLTHLASPKVRWAQLPASHLIHYKSADGTVISAFLWVPHNLPRDHKAPGVVLPHGGPTGQTLDTFNRTAEALASRGYVVIAPNVRGSTGYGKAFQHMNIKDLGGADLVDEIYGTKFMVATGYVSRDRLGITGGSYGGYMTLMAIGKHPDLWRAAVEEYGIIDWRTMLQHEDPSLQEYEKSLLGDPEKDAKVYEQDSPITFIKNETAPLLVLQGDNDIRVPKEEAQQIVSLLKNEGRTVSAHYYPAEGHGFFKIEDQVDSLTRTVAWFDLYLKGSKPGS
jgi:dipeptidyl aminopeptidase/acylaminoacyl peptidase